MEKQYHLPLVGGETYQNPLSFANAKQTNPDPFILSYRGRYYCYASDAGGVNISTSDDLVHWTYHGFAMTEPGQQEYWAPCALYHDGWFYLYYSTAPAGVFDCHQECLRVARSRDPIGGFEMVRVLYDTFTLDAHVVRDAGGDLWLFYSTNEYMGCDENAAGTVILVDHLLDPVTPEGNPRPVTLPSIAQEIYEENRFGDGRDWHTIEGAFYLEHQGHAYVMYSANAFVRENYFVGYSTAQKDDIIGQLHWKKHPDEDRYEPLVRRNSIVEGTGHNSVAKAPNLVDDWIVYHGRNCAEELIAGTEQRQMRIDPLWFDGARMATNAPSSQLQRAPRHAYVADRLAQDDARWRLLSGTVCFDGDAMHSDSTAGVTLRTLQAPVEAFVLEVWCAARPTHMGARYGVLLWCIDPLNWLEVRFDAGKRTLSLILSRGGIQSVIQTKPARFDFTAYHLLRARRTFDHFQVTIDGIQLAAKLDLPPGCTGLSARYTEACFSAFALTKTVSLWGERLRSLPRLFTADAALREENGEVYNRSPRPVTLCATADSLDDCTQDYHFALLRENAGVTVVLCEGKDGRMVFAAKHGRAMLMEQRGDLQTERAVFPLPHRDFTLRLTFEGGHVIAQAGGQAACVETAGAYRYGSAFSLDGAALLSFTMTASKILE